MKLFKDILSVALSNIAGYGTSFVLGFILPAILSVAEYGYYREFTTFLSFAYIFNLGFNDGIYIKYGGADADEVDQQTVANEHHFIILFQLIIAIIFTVLFAFQGKLTLTYFAIASLFVNLNTYHQNYQQATGQFGIYSKGNILKSVGFIVLLLFGIFVLRGNTSDLFIVLNIISLAVVFVFFEVHYLKKYGTKGSFKVDGKFELFRVGIFVLIANMSVSFIGNMGNLIVNGNFPIESFAQYAFQNSVLNVILQIVNAVGLVFYNVLAKKSNHGLISVIKDASLILGVYSGLAFFVFVWIIHSFLPQYIPSIPYLAMTFIAIPYIMVSKTLITNMYKSQRSEKKYFIHSIIYAAASFAFTYGVYLLTNSIMAIAFATTICYIAWYVFTSIIEFSEFKMSLQEGVMLVSHFVVFYISANRVHPLVGFGIYSTYLLVLLFFIRKPLMQMKDILFKVK